MNGVINVTSNGDHYNKCYNLLDGKFDPNRNKYFYPHSNPNSYVQFDFKTHKVSIDKYSILNEGMSCNKLINWDLVVSNDEQKWDPIDERHISVWDGTYNLSTYTTNNQQFYRYIRLRLKGKDSSNYDSLITSRIEFFGKLI